MAWPRGCCSVPLALALTLVFAAAIAAHDVSRAGELMARHMNIFGRKDFPVLVSLLADQVREQAEGAVRRRDA